jgi:ParB family transcriptional regulator, chromosome partitioning protein
MTKSTTIVEVDGVKVAETRHLSIEPAAATAHEVGTVVRVEPTALLLTRNIREAKPDAELIKSIKDLGVIEPITAVLTTDGSLLVRTGHRRTLAAIEAKCDTVPVYVTGTDATDKVAEVQRIVSQRDENTHRAGLTTAEEVAVVETLSGLGLSAAQVAKQARIKRADVDAALTVAASTMAKEHAELHTNLTLDQAAVIAEFEDEPETVIALVNAAKNGQFAHVAQRKRDDRERNRLMSEAAEALQAKGITVVDRPGWDATTKPLDYLVDAETGEKVTAENHAGCPGHVAWLASEWVYVDADGNEIPEDLDYDEDDPEATDPYEDAEQVQRYGPTYGCTQPVKNGHRDRYASGTSSTPKAAGLTEAEREAAKTARKLVIENNKAWDSAETVRREWLAQFTRVKTPPKGTAAFIATALCKDSTVANSNGGNKFAAEWLGIKHIGYGQADLSPAKTATENRALVIALVQILGGYESEITKASWRHDGTNNSVGRYLRFIESCGYTLSDVEKFAMSKKTA